MTDAAVFVTAILATLGSFAESGWLLTGCLIVGAGLVLAVCVMVGVRGVHRDLDELERYFDRGRR